jgi:hypothetical protein
VVDVQYPTASGRTDAAASPECLPCLRGALVESSKPLGCADAAIRDAAAVRRIELPMVVAKVRPVEIVVSPDIDVDIVPPPVEAAPQRKARGDANAPEKSVDHNGAAWRSPIGRVVRRIGGPPPTAVYDRGIVSGYVQDLRIDRRNGNVAVIALHQLLCVTSERTGGLRPSAQVLHSVHDLQLLIDERIANLLHPRKIAAHTVEHLGERAERFDARVP